MQNNQKPITLEELSAEKDKKAAVFFIELIKLYAALSASRNYLWIQELSQTFPIDFVFNQLSSKTLSPGIKK